jgi:hypothetical protein
MCVNEPKVLVVHGGKDGNRSSNTHSASLLMYVSRKLLLGTCTTAPTEVILWDEPFDNQNVFLQREFQLLARHLVLTGSILKCSLDTEISIVVQSG